MDRFLTLTLLTAFGLHAMGQAAPEPKNLSRSEQNPPAQLRAASTTGPSSRFGGLLGAVDTARSPDRPFAKTSCVRRFTRPVAGADPYGDSDGDGVEDEKDWCPDTPLPPEIECYFDDELNQQVCEDPGPVYPNDYGCLLSEMDEDNDCVNSLVDTCPQTKWGNRNVDGSGCPHFDSWMLSGVAEGDEPGDGFGQTVAVSANGRTVAVGAPDHAWLGVQGSGQVVIFTDEGDAWSSEELGDPDFINFGRTLAMSGDGSKLAVAQGASRDGDGNGILSRVQVYERSGSSWVQLGDDIALGAELNDDRDSFGAALAIDHSGETLAVGAPGSDGDTGNNDQRGEVRVYELLGNAWVQQGESIQGREEYERSGISVALSSADGTVVAIGTESNRARAYAYRLPDEDWFPRGGEVVGGVGEGLGTNVALSGSGNTLAVTLSYDGGIRTFQWGGEWRAPLGPDIRGESAVIDEVRVALSSDGTRLLASTPSSYYKDGTGRVRLYKKGPVAEDWQFEGPFVQGWYQISPDLQGEPQEFAGQAIALSGDGKTVVIGSPYYDGDSENESDNRGRVLVYRLQPR